MVNPIFSLFAVSTSVLSFLSLAFLSFCLGRAPFKNKVRQTYAFLAAAVGVAMSISVRIWLKMWPQAAEYAALAIIAVAAHAYGFLRKWQHGSVLWQKQSSGQITVEENRSKGTLILKRDGKTLSGIRTASGEPTSRLYWYPHLPELYPHRPKSVLCLGGGACAYPIYALKRDAGLTLDVIEIDPVVVEAARRFFPLPQTDHFRIITADAIRWLSKAQAGAYDLIFADIGLIFTHDYQRVNEAFIRADTLDNYRRLLKKQGTFILNVITTRKPADLQLIRKKLARFAAMFASHHIYTVNPSAGESELQDLVYIFSMQHVTKRQIKKRLETVRAETLSYSKARYCTMLASELVEP